MKVLLSAYACEPNRGSEPGVGWNVARELAQHHDVWVITRADHEPRIRAELTERPLPRLRVIGYELPRWLRMGWWRGQRGIHLHYYLWQAGLYPLACRLHREIGFDVVHHLTYVRYSAPSFLSLLPATFIWGPVGGGESIPPSFLRDLPWRGQVYEYCRGLLRCAGEIDPFVRLTARRAAIAQATTPETAARMRKLGVASIRICPESGLSDEDLAALAAPGAPRDPPTFVSMGRLLSWKGFHLGLRAFAQARLPEAEYWVLGDGPERTRLQNLAVALGIAGRVRYHPALPRHAAIAKLKQCVALVHPSLHDSGGWVCLEAMAARRPVICLDLGGPAVQVTHETGIKLRAIRPEQVVGDLGAAMVRLATDRGLCDRLGEAGRQRVEQHYRWAARGQYLSALYAQALGIPCRLDDKPAPAVREAVPAVEVQHT